MTEIDNKTMNISLPDLIRDDEKRKAEQRLEKEALAQLKRRKKKD
jgi:hypothetical protein